MVLEVVADLLARLSIVLAVPGYGRVAGLIVHHAELVPPYIDGSD